MAIDFEREGQPEKAAQRDQERQPRRHLSISDLATEAGFERRARAERQSDEEERSVGEAARKGFTDGLSDELSPGSPLGALARIAESVDGIGTKDVQDRMNRFPELREVELPSGKAARFPELAEQPKSTEQRTTDDEMER
jgi:hypothetical protein